MTPDFSDFDWEELKKTVHLAVRCLDNVITRNKYPLPEIEEATLATRKIGLGVMGWASALLYLGIAYDSEQAEILARKVMKFITAEAEKASIALAKERGVFPEWQHSTWHDSGIRIRNAALTTIAPTGTICNLANCSSGIEPCFAYAYTRRVDIGTPNEQVLEIRSKELA